jgi:hypothetical protein
MKIINENVGLPYSMRFDFESTYRGEAAVEEGKKWQEVLLLL